MAKFFLKLDDSIDSGDIDEYSDLIKNINSAKQNLQKDYENIQSVVDEKLIDYYIYKIKSDEARYDFLVKEIRKSEENKK